MSDWLRDAVIYQIYPRSFRDSNGDGVGDIKGIIDKLDYVAALGVDAIWISPFFRSPMKDFGYDVADYCDVDPVFGALGDFDMLTYRAHSLSLKVIVDLVFSHTSDQHAWFKESRFSRDNARADWYVWADAKPDGSPPNNWQSMFGGAAWSWDSRRRQYYLHNFLPSQPDLNIRNPQVQNALLDAARFWLTRGVDGFRLDVVNFYAHDALLRDNPARAAGATPVRPHEFQQHVYDRTRPEAFDFIRRLRALMDEYGAISIGEIEDDDPIRVQREYTEGRERLHSAYSFFLLRTQTASPALFSEALAGWQGASGWPAWSLSNHDVVRCATRLAGDDPQRTKVLLALLLCLRGTPILYQGDELGLPQAYVPFDRLRDPEAIAFWPHGAGRDGARTPMPWTITKPLAGFTTGDDSWLPMDPRHRNNAVDVQAGEAGSVLNFTKTLLELRRKTPALRRGDCTTLDPCGDALILERRHGDERLWCVFNLGGEPACCAPPAPIEAMLLQTGNTSPAGGSVAVHGNSALVARLVN
jgi:alpha-glucosidase